MYKVKFTPGARADLEALDPPIAQRILDKIRWLADNCDAISHTPLSNPLRGYYKLRVGNSIGHSINLTGDESRSSFTCSAIGGKYTSAWFREPRPT